MLLSFKYTSLLIIIILLNFTLTEKSDKQLKFDACYKLMNMKIQSDTQHYQELSKSMDKRLVDNIFQYALLNCYQHINYYDAEDYDTKSPYEIDINSEQISEYLSLEKWEKLFKNNNEAEFQQTAMELSEAIQDFQSGSIDFSKLQKQNMGNENTNYNQQNDDYKGVPRDDMMQDFVLFGVNFSQFSSNTKNIIGISLIIFIFMAVIGGLKWIKNIREGNIKTKKKKKQKTK